MPIDVTLDEVKRLRKAGAQVVEVLPRGEYVEGHIAGAVNVPLKDLPATASAALDPSQPVVVYCWDST